MTKPGKSRLPAATEAPRSRATTLNPAAMPADSAVTVRAPSVEFPPVGHAEHAEDRGPRFDDPSGRLLDRGEVGRGGMGSIRRVEDLHIGRHAALKLPHDHLRESPDAMRRFAREAQILGRLDHPNVVPLYDLMLDEHGAPVHFMMKLVQGETLYRRVSEKAGERRGEEELRDLLSVLVKVCEALSFAHGQGVLHRDLKPENVMIGSHGQVYVMDWGIAGLRGHVERSEGEDQRRHETREGSPSQRASNGFEHENSATTSILGTPQYMAPEQAWGDHSKIGPCTDVFALGAILYFILTGRPPHRGGTAAEAWILARDCEIAQPTAVAPDAAIPPRLALIAMRAMARDPNDRYPTVDALKADLDRFLRSGLWFSSRTFPAGTVILRDGEEGELAFIIEHGRCEAFRGEGGSERVLRTMGPGDVFGEMAILTKGRRTASVRAIEDVTAMVVSRDSLVSELGVDSWLAAFVRTIASRFRELEVRDSEP